MNYQGPKFGSAAAGTGWTNPTNVLADDDARATFNLTTQADLKVTGFGFTIPAAATIAGIEARHRGQGSSATAAQRQVRVGLTKNGTALAGARKTALEYAQDTDTDIASGGAADLWSAAWTPAEINAAGFGVLLSDNDAVAAQLSIDSIQVIVHYTIPAFDTLATTVEARIQDDAGKLSDAARDDCIREAIRDRYSRFRPQDLVKDLSGDGSTYQWTLNTTNFPSWDEARSSIAALEYPAGQRPPTFLEADDWTLVRTATATRALQLPAITPTSGDILRVTYTAPHADDASTVPAGDIDAVANMAASLACRRLQAVYSRMGDSSIGADAVDYRGKADGYGSLAKALETRFEEAMGTDEEDQAPAASGTATWTPESSGGLGRLTH